jgi:hypothetical protein
MWWTIGKRVMSVFVILWMTAVGGILGANMLAIIGTQFFIQENKGEYVQPWSHAGWYAGTILLFIASVTGRLRFMNGTRLGGLSTQSAQQPETRNDRAAASETSDQHKEPSSGLSFIFVGGLAGGFLGFLLGANLLIFWFSLAYSPFAPKQVVSSVEIVREQRPGSVFKRPVMRSSHPISLYLCLTPAAIGILAGATAAGIIALKYRDEDMPSSVTGRQGL